MKVQSGSDSAALRVLNAGSVTLHVQTKYASVTHLIGEVDCYELPPFQLPTNILPAPHIPALNAFIAPNVLRRDMEVPLPAWPSSMGQLTQGMASFVSTAPSVDNLGVSLVQAIQASGIYALGAELVGGFPLPDTASLTAGLIESLEEQLATAVGARTLPNIQALAYMRTIQELTEQLAYLEANAP